MAVKVCDMIMGAGKSQSAITYMNEHPDEHFVYITPYLEESDRIKKDCPQLHFAKPSNRNPDCEFSKTRHTAQLLEAGRNITTTHAAFKLYTADMIESIKRWGYTLIVDEAVDVLEQTDIHPGDLEAMMEGGYITRNANGQYERTVKEYRGSLFRPAFAFLERNVLVRTSVDGRDHDEDDVLYWKLSPNVFQAFKDVYILTYLFNGTDMHFFLRYHSIPYENVGVSFDGERYRFAAPGQYMPEYTGRLSELIQISDHVKCNAIGAGRTALSASWYSNATDEEIKQVKNHTYNILRNVWESSAYVAMWTTFKDYEKKVFSKGFGRCFVQCSCKATNAYRMRRDLAYLVNVFENPYKRNYVQRVDPQHDENQYALSSMIQWIWRSAIRDGKPIRIYIPSERMRGLLKEWIAQVEAEYVQYITGKEGVA